MTQNPIPPTEQRHTIEAVDARLDHVRGPAGAPLIVEYGDYECPYSRHAYRSIERLEAQLSEGPRFAFRHFPLTEIHPHALAAAAAAEAAALQEHFWKMHNLLFHRPSALADDDLRGYAALLELDVVQFDRDRTGPGVIQRIGRDVESALASREIGSTPHPVHRRRGVPRGLRRRDVAGGRGEMSAA